MTNKEKEKIFGCDSDDCAPNMFSSESSRESDYDEYYPTKLNIPKSKQDFPIPTYEQITEWESDVFLLSENLRDNIIGHIKQLVYSIDCPLDQKAIFISKSIEILDKFISDGSGDKIIIYKRQGTSSTTKSNLKLIAGTVVYTVSVSTEGIPKISARVLSEILELDVRETEITRLYNNWFKDSQKRFDFPFQHTHWGKSRENIALFLYGLLIDNEFDTHKLVLRLKDIFSNKIKTNQLIPMERELLEQLRDFIHIYYEMAINYSDTFTKYFSDFVEFIKLLIVSNRTHKIIGADFSLIAFIRYLMTKTKIDLFLTEKTHKKWSQNIINFLKESKYSDHFPPQMQSLESGMSHRNRNIIVGSKIKLYVMQHIYNGKYYLNGVSVCPDCMNEGFIINTVFPRIRSKEFHHKQDKVNVYTSNKLFSLFVKDRGNPYFLSDLIKKMESEKVILKCSIHHQLNHSDYFSDFRKFINWENIPEEFPQDIYSIPAEIIHILSMICIDNFHKTKLKNTNQKAKIRIFEIIYNIKKRYIIDIIYNGFCPACKEISIKDHLSSFDFNHLFELRKTLYNNGEIREKLKENGKREFSYKDLSALSCTEIVKKLIKEQGSFVCRNCHRVIQYNIQFVDQIYSDKVINKLVRDDFQNTNFNFNQNLISEITNIENPLETDLSLNRSLIDYLFAIFDILKLKESVDTDDLMNVMNRGRSTVNNFFNIHKNFLNKYGKIKRTRRTNYFLNKEGKKFVRLMIYFRDYYKNIRSDILNNYEI